MIRRFLFICLGLFIQNPAYGQVLSDVSLRVFWQTMDQIETKDTVSPEDWNRLWNSPGYNFWTDTEKSQRIFYNYYTLVHDPKLKDSLQNEMNRSKGYRLTIFNHLIEAKQKQSELTAFVRKLKDSNIIEEAKQEALAYLPDSLSIENDSTVIALMIFQPDAFAVGEKNLILLDALFAYNYDEGFEKFLGHELHHAYLMKYVSNLKTIEDESEFSPLTWSIDKLRTEGIADLIDKENILEKTDKSDYDLEYCRHYKASKKHLQKIDSLLQEIAKDQTKVEALGKEIRRELPFGAHPTGLYIAHIIKEKMGKEGLLKCLKSPFPFLYLYNDIAIESQGEYPIFSTESMNYLKTLEQDFVEPAQNKRQ